MKNKRSSFWGQLNREKWLILFCLILAFLAWQGIRQNVGIEVPVSNIAVDVNVPEGWAVWEKSAHSVNILFRGSREDIRYLNNEQMRVVIPVTDPTNGSELTVELTDAFLRNPTAAKAESFSPSEITIRLDQEVNRQLPVKAAVNGALPEGQEIDRIVCTPASVRVAGARRMLDEMEYIHTEPVELKDRQGSFKESARIAVPQAGRLRVEPDWVTVEVFVAARNSTTVLENIPVQILSSPGERRSITVEPQVIHVTVSGKQQRIERLGTAEVSAFVDCSELTENTGYDLPVRVVLPSDLQQVKTEPPAVHVQISN